MAQACSAKGSTRGRAAFGGASSRVRAAVAALIGSSAVCAALFGAAAPAAGAAVPAPTNLRLVPGVESLHARWSVTTTVGLRGFRVRWRALSGSTWSAPVERPASARGFTIYKLASEPYVVRVRTVLSTGELGSAEAEVGTPLPAKVEEGGEELPKEESPGEEGEAAAAVVGRAPVGPPAPASGWHVAYADAFGAPLGPGPVQDSTLQAGEKWNGCCTNSDEVAVEQRAQVRVGKHGLEEVCSLGIFTVEGHTRGAACGSVRGDSFFEFTPAAAGEWAVECYVRMPVDLGGADPGCWTYPSAGGEIDFFELWGWNGSSWSSANGGMPVVVGQGEHELSPVDSLGFDPSAGFHRYTTAFVPEASGRYDVREYIDGRFRWAMPGRTLSTSSDGLILTNALRVLVQPDVFTVRSIAFWQDGAHAGHGVRGGGVAPGTTLAP